MPGALQMQLQSLKRMGFSIVVLLVVIKVFTHLVAVLLSLKR